MSMMYNVGLDTKSAYTFYRTLKLNTPTYCLAGTTFYDGICYPIIALPPQTLRLWCNRVQ